MDMERRPAELAADPGTDPTQLQKLATDYPQLRATIARNPAAYPALLDWLASFGDPLIDQALASRGDSGVRGGQPSAPSSGESPRKAGDPDEPAPTIPERKSAFPQAPQAPRDPGALPVTPPVVPPADPFGDFTSSKPAKKKTNATLWIVLAVLAILALVTVGAAIWLFIGGPGTDEKPGAQSKVETPEETQMSAPSQTPETETPSPTAATPVYPAPPGALAEAHFVSPSGNIACQMGETQTVCTIFENSYAASGYQSCEGPTSFVIDSAGARLDCSVPAVSTAGAPSLDYDTASAFGDFACLSTANGVNCWDTITGGSVAFARDGWINGISGAIPTNRYPWG